MTGRRKNSSPVGSPPSDTDSGTIIGTISESFSKEQDRFLPIANVSRIMKKSLPANAKISKEAKETVQECVSEFISFITGEASDKCQKEKRKTINGDDLLWAMTALGFENYVGSLKIYLNKYREAEGEKNSMARQGDQSPTEDTTDTNYGVNKVTNLTSNIKANHSDFDGAGGFNLCESPVIPQRFGDGGRVFGYGDNSNMGAMKMGIIHEKGDGINGNRVKVNHGYGVEW